MYTGRLEVHGSVRGTPVGLEVHGSVRGTRVGLEVHGSVQRYTGRVRGTRARSQAGLI